MGNRNSKYLKKKYINQQTEIKKERLYKNKNSKLYLYIYILLFIIKYVLFLKENNTNNNHHHNNNDQFIKKEIKCR